MNEKYAVFIWTSYALALAVLAWNVVGPKMRRSELKQQLSDAVDFSEPDSLP